MSKSLKILFSNRTPIVMGPVAVLIMDSTALIETKMAAKRRYLQVEC